MNVKCIAADSLSTASPGDAGGKAS